MGDISLRMMELALEGFGCSQIILKLALEAQGKDNPDLLRAISGLHGGLGYSGKVCGALSGACCLIALYVGRATSDEPADSRLSPMIAELVEWFESEYKGQYGGIDCAQLLGGDPRNQISRCPLIIQNTFEKAKEILAANGIELSQCPRGTK